MYNTLAARIRSRWHQNDLIDQTFFIISQDYMIEGTPGQPYGHLPVHYNMVEANMRLR